MPKRLIIPFVTLLLLALQFTSCATQQERAERRARTRQAVEQAVAQRRLKIEVSSMSTLRYGSRMVTPDFYLELRGDTLVSYLPYLGQARQAPMASPSEGLNFTAEIGSLQETRLKHDVVRLDVMVRTREDIYGYAIEVSPSGMASISVQSQHRDPISFSGHCVTE
ncbi:MAG: DUF4251 domain-containing protein [Prevotella sp.]|nr:DUF4251 domain-containing protein [Prevotella sp.]